MAGVSTKDIKNRIRSMESTKQITKAMEMVAASKLRQAQNRVLASRPYFEILYGTISDIVANNRDFSSPYLKPQAESKALFIVIAGDRGLAPQLSLATRGEDWASQGQPKGKAEIPVVTRECRRNSRKTPWFPPLGKMRPLPATASQGKSPVPP